MKAHNLIRLNIVVGIDLSMFGAACQESKSKTFERSNSIGTYSKSNIMNEDIETFVSGEQYASAVDELGELTPLAYFEETFTGLVSGSMTIDDQTLELSEDDIFNLKEHYTELNLVYDSMAQMWEDNNFDPYSLTSDDFHDAVSVSLDAISGVHRLLSASLKPLVLLLPP